jgi:hypothetical protein
MNETKYQIGDRVVVYGNIFDRFSARTREECIVMACTNTNRCYKIRSCRMHRVFFFPLERWIDTVDIYGRIATVSDQLDDRLSE